MSDCFVGEIRLFAFPRVPRGWVACDGSMLPIPQYQALYALIGTTYGGDGSSQFAVPDLRGRVPIDMGTSNQGNTYVLGQRAGEETHQLSIQEMPGHSHPLISTANTGTTAVPGPGVHLATANLPAKTLYAPVGGIAGYDVMADSVSYTGNGLPHDNMMPSLVMNFCIAVEGVFPTGD
jgi:microcystin-dependent protein